MCCVAQQQQQRFQPLQPHQQQQQQQQQQPSLPKQLEQQPASSPVPVPAPPRDGAAGAEGVWVPISGPPSDGSPEMRRMVLPADAEEPSPASLVEVAALQQLTIGKREAREQAVALATASAEIVKWKAIAERALAAKQLLTERTRELKAQRDQSMAINRELLPAFRRLQGQLQDAVRKLKRHEADYTGLRQELLDLREAAATARPAPPAPERARDGGGLWPWSVLGGGGNGNGSGSGNGAGAAGGAGGAAAESSPGAGDEAMDEVTVMQLLQLSEQAARDAEIDLEKMKRLEEELRDGGGGNGNGAWQSAWPEAEIGGDDSSSDSSGGGGGITTTSSSSSSSSSSAAQS